MVSARANDTVPTVAATDDRAPVGPPLRLAEGQQIGPYRVIRYLGSGAMGVVYEAVDDDLAERVAIKTLLRADPWRLFRLKHEFRALAGVRHVNLVRHDELTAASGTWFFAMEYVDGVDLVSDHRGAPARLRASLAQLVAGVQALHDAGVLHLDLKPANILVDRSGRVVILDFGLADFRDTAHVSPREHIAGTPGYIAPERLGGAAPEPASDWYAVGVILFELLVGRLPGTLGRPSAYVSDVPQDLDDLCDALLAQDPTARPTGAEIVHRLGNTLVPSIRYGARAPLLGRTAEIATLSRAIADASPGIPGLVRVSGKAGVGKTHFVRHALDTLARAGDLLVLSGRCYECESVPYGGMDTVIDMLARRVPPGLAADDEISEAAALFPVLSARLGHMTRNNADPEDRPAAFRGVRSLLARVAGPRPVVLFLDDLHHAGADTAALLLDLLVARGDNLVMTIVATFRSDLEDASVCLRELAARAQVRGQKFSEVRIALPALDQDTCETLVRWHLGEGDGSRVAELARESGGNPFLAELLTSEATAAVDVLGELIRRRIDGLPEASRMLLAVVALAGQPLSQGALLRAAPVEQARAALAALRLALWCALTGPVAGTSSRSPTIASPRACSTRSPVRTGHSSMATSLTRSPRRAVHRPSDSSGTGAAPANSAAPSTAPAKPRARPRPRWPSNAPPHCSPTPPSGAPHLIWPPPFIYAAVTPSPAQVAAPTLPRPSSRRPPPVRRRPPPEPANSPPTRSWPPATSTVACTCSSRCSQRRGCLCRVRPSGRPSPWPGITQGCGCAASRRHPLPTPRRCCCDAPTCVGPSAWA